MADEKMTIRKIRENLLMLNNPEVPVESRQRALTSLMIELCDRVTELGIETGQWFSTINEGLSAALSRTPQAADAPMATVTTDPNGGVPAPMAAPAGPVDAAAQAAAEIAALPTSMRGNVTAVVPGGSAPPPPNGDAAAVAAVLNKTGGVPSAQVISQKVQ